MRTKPLPDRWPGLANFGRFSKKRFLINWLTSSLAVWLLASVLLTACGEESRPPARANIELPGDATATPPFPARGGPPTPTATSSTALIGNNSPPPLFPTSTPPPQANPTTDFGATAGAASEVARLTPTAIPTGQLAYIQAGNLWLIDDTGSNRRQLTESNDIGSDAVLSWNLLRDRLVYISRAGEMWALDLQGKRTLVFSPGRSAKVPTAVKLPPLPTAPIQTPENGTPRPAATPTPTRSGPVVSGAVWSADGRYVAFNYYAAESGTLASGEVWLADLLTDKIALTRIGEGFGPSWSPDSRTLGFLSRGEPRSGPPAPSPNLTPRGTSLLPPTRASNADPLAGPEAAVTPGITPTAFIIRPGSTLPPNATENGLVTVNLPPTTTPTPTLNLVALPSPTPTPTYPPVYYGNYVANKLLLYNLGSRKISVGLESERLPDAFVDTTGTLRSYVPAPMQAVWWSPDGRYIAFADRLSIVGVIAVVGNSSPVIWTGSPQGFTTYELEWLPRSDGAFLRYGNPYSDDGSRVLLVSFTNPNNAGSGVNGDVTNRAIIRLDVLPGIKASCPALTPGGNFFSYYDGTALIITRTDGSIYSTFSDAQCPAWSPFGRNFATVRKGGDGALVLSALDQPQQRILLAARAIDRVYWLRSDPSYLGGQPAPAGPAPTAVPNPLTPRP